MLRRATIWAAISGTLLGAFLLLRPYTAYFGAPEPSRRTSRAASVLPGGSVAAPSPSDSASRPSAPVRALGEVESAILDLVNAERRQRGLARLRSENRLAEVARQHSEDMIVRDFFSHTNPDAEAVLDRVARQHRQLIGLVGENIWSGFAERDPATMAQSIMDGWMGSPGHRENVLRPTFTHLGVGVTQRDSFVTATQNFAQVQAYTDAPVPTNASTGEELRLAASPTPARVDVWNPTRGLKAAGPSEPSSIGMPSAPGQYRLRFYFPTGGSSYAIYNGPSIEVK